MGPLINNIENSVLITEVYGEWTDFHDAKVLELTVRLVADSCSVSLRAPGFWKGVRIDAVVSLEFSSLQFEHLPEFDGIFDILALDIEFNKNRGTARGFRVVILPAAGAQGTFYCRRIRVAGVRMVES